MRATRSAALFGALLVGGCWQVLAAGREWAVVRTIQVGGEGGWDYLTVDPHKHLLYVPRTTETAVIDAQSGKVIAKIPGQKRAHGVAIVPEVGRGFISDGGGDGAVVIFDLKTNQVLGTVAGQPDADGIIFDSASRRVLVVSGDNGVLMPLKPDIDAKSGTLDAALDLGGKPEFLASDGQGKVYINLEDKNEVVVVDTKAMRVTARWPVAPGGAPVGLALDVKKGRLFVGCRNPHKLVVMSTADGKILADLPIGEGVDAVKLDRDEAFASCRDGSLAVVRETSAGVFEIVQTVKTPLGARTMGIDPTSHTIYLPTADFEEPKPGATGRPVPKPGTFKVVVVARQQ